MSYYWGRDLTIPASWRQTLDTAQMIWPEAVIAGGALRDLEHGRGIKDVDIFVPARQLNKVRALFPGARLWDEPDLPSRCTFGDVIPDHYLFTQEGWNYEIVPKYEPLDYLLDHFDIGLCMIKYNGKQIFAAPEYREDARRQQITIIRATGGEMVHAERIAEKYPGWPIVNATGEELL